MIKQKMYIIPLIWATAVVTIAGIGIKTGAQLFLLGALIIVCGMHGVFRKKAWRRYPVAGLIVLMFLAASLVSSIELSLWWFPPVTPDGLPVMPLGQTFGGIALGTVCCSILSWLYFARLKPNPRAEAIWVYATLAVLAIAFTVDYFF